MYRVAARCADYAPPAESAAGGSTSGPDGAVRAIAGTNRMLSILSWICRNRPSSARAAITGCASGSSSTSNPTPRVARTVWSTMFHARRSRLARSTSIANSTSSRTVYRLCRGYSIALDEHRAPALTEESAVEPPGGPELD